MAENLKQRLSEALKFGRSETVRAPLWPDARLEKAFVGVNIPDAG